MRPLFASWSEVAPRLSASRVIALFLDFDGTLTDIRPRPELVRVHPDVRRALAALARSPRFRVWVISARRRAQLRELVGVPGIRYLGLYGWERAEGMSLPGSPIAQVRALLCAALPAHPAVWIEDKEHSVGVHFRGASEDLRRLVTDCVYRAVVPWRSRLRIAPGKCLLEAVPLEFGDKGSAVRRELAPYVGHALALYVGDDRSDEAAFAALPEGIGVRVGPLRPTHARYRVNHASDVRRLLEKLQSEFL
jgi:trehalose-phosphatase